jgi:hypothetical protein
MPVKESSSAVTMHWSAGRGPSLKEQKHDIDGGACFGAADGAGLLGLSTLRASPATSAGTRMSGTHTRWK